MSCQNSRRGRCGFTLVELVSVLAITVSATAVLGPSFGGMRNKARGLTSEGNLMSIGQAGAMYGIDNGDRIFSFSWREGDLVEVIPGQFLTMQDDQSAASYQVQNILIRATGRVHGEGRIQTPSSRLMHRRWSHLVLVDYMGGDVADPIWVDPADANQRHWQLNPIEYLEDGNSFPYGNGASDQMGFDTDQNWIREEIIQLWPFASSYQTVPHAWMSDFGPQYTPHDSSPHTFLQSFGSGQTQLGRRLRSEVVFPSAKVHMFEEFDRERAGSPYFAYDHAQSAKLMFDGSINTMASGLAQTSVSPLDYLEGNRDSWVQTYVPLDTFPVPLGGLGDQTLLNQRFRWTLGGLSGVNYQRTIMSNGR